MSLVIGLTGGIASGKSTCSDYLIRKGYRVFDSDIEVKKLYSDGIFLNKMKNLFPRALDSNGNLSKELLRKNIFSNINEAKKLEEFIHPIIEEKCDIFINENESKKAIFLDVPLLFEADWNQKCDITVSIIANENLRKKRYIKRGGNLDLFDKILSRQLSDGDHINKSDYIILNNSTIEDFYKNIDEFLLKLKINP